ncbi:OmpA family protein [Histidinibacterium aquaticum]|uniref:OmpA family protein n=1 Tax=Histidinibacterium aquaticum TaxID=2613962 RepID=A0A5J5GSQ4_9RHOB|nr:OmpA family protein [Histidinibacterium aquaticum]KAA9010564.1 OmpA family protein [Histidinibacterium aquaticum]
MRLSAILPPLAVFALAALLSVVGARAAVGVVEDRSVTAVREALTDEGMSWTSVLGDGLQIILEGEAPSEAVRFRAITVAGTQVDASRVIDNMSVADPDGIAPPEFAIEILRNDGGVTLIGLVPETTDREAMADRISQLSGGITVTDLLESADHAAPESWRPALDFAISSLADLPRSKVSVTAGRVAIVAMTDSPEAKRRLESQLVQRRPDPVRLALDVSAPRPVITPFITRFVIDEDGARFEACAADSEETSRRISRAAREAGFEGSIVCPVGLGVPSRTWGEAVAQGIAAVGELGGGTVTLTDADVTLVAPVGTEQAMFDRVVGELGNDLPELFALEAVLPEPPDETEDEVAEFTATLSPEGLVQLRGRVADALMNTTAENYAKASFGSAEISMGTRISEEVPQGWSVRVLAAIEALSVLENGSVLVRPESFSVSGVSGRQQAQTEISQLLVEKLGPEAEFEVQVRYEESLDPIAALPTPEECLQQITTVTDGRKITFEPGSADITGEAQSVMDDIAEILRRCADLQVEVAGYTDSQGREEMNQRLSQDRAESVLRGLRERRVPVGSFRAVGYGEENPIADNETEEGREANRRIEFSLIDPEAEDAAAGDEETEPTAEVSESAETDGDGNDGDDEQD